MRDRLVFEEGKLSNGIATYHAYGRSKTAHVAIHLPVGIAHCHGEIRPGTFHCLEHMVFNRSEQHPTPHAFERFVGLHGGFLHASTSMLSTRFTLEIPTKYFSAVWPAFLSHVFSPVLTGEDLALERGVISSEMRMRAGWYPAKNEEDHYVLTQWRNSNPVTLVQSMGSDEDLRDMTVSDLLTAHAYYRHPDVWVMTGGANPTDLYRAIEEIPVVSQPLPRADITPLSWKRPEYHEKGFRDVTRFKYQFGGIEWARPSLRNARVMHFILTYLTNTIQGPLYEWVRRETGWTYELGIADVIREDGSHSWTILFPLPNRELVDVVRRELPGKIHQALTDKAALRREVKRQRSMMDAYWHPTLKSVIDDAQAIRRKHGRICSVAELKSILMMCQEPQVLLEVWNTYTAPGKTGEFCATPLAS